MYIYIYIIYIEFPRNLAQLFQTASTTFYSREINSDEINSALFR